jgi:predicted O-methyltransferase YrrM
LITLEYDPRHASVATENIARAGLSDRVEIRVGAAIDSLPQLVSQGPFDFVFIDADKKSTADYFTWSLKLTRPGSVIIVDNVIRSGGVIDGNSTDEGVLGIRRFNDLLKNETRVDATSLQTVGAKGYDGFTVALVR